VYFVAEQLIVVGLAGHSCGALHNLRAALAHMHMRMLSVASLQPHWQQGAVSRSPVLVVLSSVSSAVSVAVACALPAATREGEGVP
jgi:hypothetical protein